METNDDFVKYHGSKTLTYMPWHEHCRYFLLSQRNSMLIHFAGLLSAFCGSIEALDFFYPKLNLSNAYTLSTCLAFASLGAAYRSIRIYRNTVPDGLEHEPINAQRIAFSKKPYWEYALAYELIKSRIQAIDSNLEDLISNRVHIKITKIMTAEQYMEWLRLRPVNLVKIVNVTKQLLIFDLIDSIQADESNEVDFNKLIRTINLIKDLYQSAYNFEVEGREIDVPEGFEVVHEIQSDWISVVRSGFNQMLDILKSVAERENGDYSPLDKTIIIGAPPRIDEFCKELDRIKEHN